MNACINVTESGRGNPKIFWVHFVHQWLNPLSKFLDPPLLTLERATNHIPVVDMGKCKQINVLTVMSFINYS